MSNKQEAVTHVLLKKNFPFPPLTKVLVRPSDDAAWDTSTFYICRPEQKKPFICEAGPYEQAIAYKGNEHLLCKPFPEGYVSVGDSIVCREHEGCRVWKKSEIPPAPLCVDTNSPLVYIEYYLMVTHAHLIGTELPADTPAPDKRTFKAFERVLVRDREDHVWTAAHFSHYDDEEYEYRTTGGVGYRFCVPYKGNEDSVGTDD